MFQLGLFGGKTSHTETELPEIARDEQQEIKVVSNAQPSEQVFLDLIILLLLIRFPYCLFCIKSAFSQFSNPDFFP